MPKYSNELVSQTSLALLKPLLAALDPTDKAILKPTSSLPSPCFWVPPINTIVCATSINTLPIFRAAMISAAVINKVDVILIGHGFWPEELDDVVIDVVTWRDRAVHMLWSMGRYCGADGSTWLVQPPGSAGQSVLLDADGVTTTVEPPYADLDERWDGLSRAARETIRSMRALRRS